MTENQVVIAEVAYLAGLFDGEGCVHIDKAHTLRCVVGMTTDGPIEKLHDRFGGSTGLKLGTHLNQRDQYRWSVSGKSAYEFLKTIRPYLTVKNRHADLAMEFWEGKRKYGDSVPRRVPEAEKEVREKFRTRMGELNHDGLPQSIRKEIETARDLIKAVIEKYRDQFPSCWENYTLILLLAIREQGVFIPPDAIEMAARRELPNLTTLHRAMTKAKKAFQTVEQKARSDALEDDWRTVLGGTS